MISKWLVTVVLLFFMHPEILNIYICNIAEIFKNGRTCNKQICKKVAILYVESLTDTSIRNNWCDKES